MAEKREYKLFIDDIIDSIEKIETYTIGLTLKDFENNLEKQDAIIRRSEIIGEAVKNIPSKIKIQFPEIPWRNVAGLRDVVIHNYFGISPKRLWKIIKQDLPASRQWHNSN
jgi:uncharacterized protein with HEPN domain